MIPTPFGNMATVAQSSFDTIQTHKKSRGEFQNAGLIKTRSLSIVKWGKTLLLGLVAGVCNYTWWVFVVPLSGSGERKTCVEKQREESLENRAQRVKGAALCHLRSLLYSVKARVRLCLFSYSACSLIANQPAHLLPISLSAPHDSSLSPSSTHFCISTLLIQSAWFMVHCLNFKRLHLHFHCD